MKNLYTSNKLIDIHTIQTILYQEKIKYFVADEQMTNILPHYSFALGGMRIMVNDEDYENAFEIINEYFNKNKKPVEKYVKKNNETPKCPHCNSENISITKIPLKITSIFLSILFMIPIPIKKKYYQCNECKSYWDIKH